MKKITIDCAGISDAAQMHAMLKKALSLPDWYGHNLDALFDCLTEISEETQLSFLRWDSLGSWRDGFASVFEDTAVENKYFSYTVA